MPKPTGILDQEPETIDRPLTEEEQAEITAQKENMDWDSPPPEKVEDGKAKDVEPIKDKEEEGEEPEVKLTDEEEAGLDKLAEDQGKSVEEVRKELVDRKIADSKKTDEEKEQDRIEAIAKAEGITVDEVKESESKDKAVLEKYGNDPAKIAKALRAENSSYGKIKAEHDKLVKFKREIETQQARFNEKRVNDDLEAQRDKIVSEYIRINPDEAEEDEAVLFERAKIKVKEALTARDKALDDKLQEDADDARTKLIEKVPEEYKEFIPEIKGILSQEDNKAVLNEEFDIINLCHWSRGKKYTPAYVKTLIEAAEKRGKEQPEIIESKNKSISASSRGTGKQSQQATASNKDIERALEMFASKDDWTQEKKVQEYMDNHKKHDNWD